MSLVLYGKEDGALNSVELHRCCLLLVWKWRFCKDTFLSQESISLHENVAHSAAGHLELQDFESQPWQMLPAHMVVRHLHPGFLKTCSASVSKQGAVVTFVKYELLVHFSWNSNFPPLRMQWLQISSWFLTIRVLKWLGLRNLQTSEANIYPLKSRFR